MQDTVKFDIVILGTGPAGLQAAIHAARRKVAVLLLGKQTKSSLYHAHVENFCCIFNIAGEDMLRVGLDQALRFGSDIWEEDVLKVSQIGDLFEIKTESGRFGAKVLLSPRAPSATNLVFPERKSCWAAVLAIVLNVMPIFLGVKMWPLSAAKVQLWVVL
jgi:thioredoxin reductase (NADPH)